MFHILVTFGLALVIQELVIIAWGPVGQNVSTPVEEEKPLPAEMGWPID